MSAYEWFIPRGRKHAIRRLKPKSIEVLEIPERHQTVIVDSEPQPTLAEDIGDLRNNQHLMHQRIHQMEGQQEFLVAASEKLLCHGVRQSRKLDDIDHEMRYGSRIHTRPEPPYIREREVSYITPGRAERLLLEYEGGIRHGRSGSIDRADRAYIGDGVTYITSRHGRRRSWQPRHYAESDSSSDGASTVFDYEPPRRLRRPIVHQRACECGGVGYHLTDCPKRARW